MISTREDLLAALRAADTNGGIFRKKDVFAVAHPMGIEKLNWLLSKDNVVSRGVYDLSAAMVGVTAKPAPVMSQPVAEITSKPVAKTVMQPKLEVIIDNLVPRLDATYVPFGFYTDLIKVLKAEAFYPTFISGLSGNGKTTMIEQACAKLKRECLRVNISVETDEDDLIGGNTLVDGNVVYREGPVLTAMKRGAILILDEIDRGSNKLMCIQAILEGKPYFNKKNGDVIHPASGFTVIATANTKGQGSDSGKYIAAQILDEAFLERFPITVEQEYPSAKVERTIIMNNMEQHSCVDEEFADKLVTWAEVIRKTYLEDAVDELISTRRLVHIVKAFSMFRDRQKAIELCINRFDSDTKNAFLDLYKKMEAPVEEPVAPIQENTMDEDIPF
jgi:MoxR-like ATPase